ncbi:outer envelope pore protein 37, chloroplastic isoform X1 [Magnolia sinica]|uniref:outer envelope pore protein 37, chloroplastic isoform X1 n=1 Tax=Magnolia sinica TaxID=86752 RepID=UPI002658A255|nr:outer envelope pore protein 37, chloroplastic isoform X1 [Magnolia sinica]
MVETEPSLQNPSSLSPSPNNVSLPESQTFPPSPPKPNFSLPIPAIRVTSEFDSDSAVFFHKISCKLFDRLAKLKLSFQNNRNGEISDTQISFVTKYLSILYDPEEQNALVKGSFDVGSRLQFRAAQDVKSGQIGETNYFRLGCSTKCLSMSCTSNDNKSILSCINLASVCLFKYHHRKAQQGEVAMVASLTDSCKLELSSAVPSNGLPRATVRFPLGEVSVEEKEDEEMKRALSINGILKGQILNGVCTAQYRDDELNLRYSYKDEEMTFIPSISLPSNVLSFAFKRRFSPSDKLSYWYNFNSSYWSTVYKHTVGKNLKFKAGYDSEVRFGWASLWVGEEDGKAKALPMKMKVQFMLQVPQDNIESSVFMFRVKKRWDF